MEAPKFNFGNGLEKTGAFLVTHKKPILYVGGALAIVAVGYAVTKGVTGNISNFFKGEKVVGASAFNLQPVDLTKVTISEIQAKNYAEQLYNAMIEGYNPMLPSPIWNVFSGTDKTTIENVFKKLNSEDFKMVYNAFKRRSYNKLLGTTNKITDLTGQFRNLDLVEWLKSELDILDFSLKNKIRPVIVGAGFSF